MHRNVGKFDRTLRVVLGAVILGAGFLYHNWLGVIGIIPLATAFLGWCPLYSLLGLNTCPAKEHSQ